MSTVKHNGGRINKDRGGIIDFPTFEYTGRICTYYTFMQTLGRRQKTRKRNGCAISLDTS